MILHAVRWKEAEDKSFIRSEFVVPEEAIAKAKELKEAGKHDVNIKLVDTRTDKFVGNLSLE
ncbi:hypothetical protein [Terribacillus sp. JSM ZJ617]|uniref:hypothetical protein n=1 Tax=Terribacillus sp. JSM ZJ617 TaxID=3342119 RepID=UPI0035A88DDC